MRKLWLDDATALVMAAAALGVLAVPTGSAYAQEWLGVHTGPFGLGGAGIAHTQGYPGGTMGPNAQTYYPDFSISSSYAPSYTYQPTGEAAGYGYSAPYTYQGSNYQGTGAPAEAGGMTSPNTRANYGYNGNGYPGPGYQGAGVPAVTRP